MTWEYERRLCREHRPNRLGGTDVIVTERMVPVRQLHTQHRWCELTRVCMGCGKSEKQAAVDPFAPCEEPSE